VVFNETSIDPDNFNPTWDGTVDNNGKEAEEGIYFYKYVGVGLSSITGEPGYDIQGQGFLHLIR